MSLDRCRPLGCTALLTFCFALLSVPASSSAGLFADQILPITDEYCLDCHDENSMKGELNLESFYDESEELGDRELWKKVYDMLDANMMPPPKRKHQPSLTERASLLKALEEYLTLPDPDLGQVNPGKPIVSRLNRLQYNNTVRDLFELDHDVFMLPDRLPTRRHPFYAEEAGLPDSMIINIREFGSKYTVLLPMSGLPGENRVAHGFNNRGDAMNVSPLQLEKYISLAGELVNHPSLPVESSRFLALIGEDIDSYCRPDVGGRGGVLVSSARQFATKDIVSAAAPENDISLSDFRRDLEAARGRGGAALFDIPEPFQKEHLFGSGGIIAVKYGAAGQKRFTINPSLGISIVPLAGATGKAKGLCLVNGHATEKYFDLVLQADANDPGEEIRSLGLCVLDLEGNSGYVTVTVTLGNQKRISRTALLREGRGGTFFGFEIPAGSPRLTVTVDGAAYGGKYVALGDIAVVTAAAKPGNRGRRDPWKVADRSRPGWKDQAPRLRLQYFLNDAFRRKATEDEVDRFYQIYRDAAAEGETGADAMRMAIQSALSSPQFLFRIELDAAEDGSIRELDDFELANRLSYFLWASKPDGALYHAANRGRLGDPSALEEQAKRMMKDARVRELCETFAVQWLRLDQIYAAKPDREVFGAFYRDRLEEDTLHDDMILEAVLLFETILVEDRSILDLIDADYSWLNANLLDIYELDSLRGDLLAATPMHLKRSTGVTNRSNYNLWHRVSLPDKTRGGVVTMGGPLTLTSTPLNTSPIKRGNWLLESLFNRPPPEPAMNFVLEDDEDGDAAEPKTLRERFEMHRSSDGCYTCHSRIDPLGFALEGFDPIGRVRGMDNGVPVDASGVWNGIAYETPVEFKAALMERPREFVRGFIEHMLSYAIGRELEYYDMVTVRDIQEKLEQRGYRFSELIFEIVKSDPFRKTGRHAERAAESL
ncbi:MAG: DUF1592 domain-containing protein [Verrucomicrobiota bacterium]